MAAFRYLPKPKSLVALLALPFISAAPSHAPPQEQLAEVLNAARSYHGWAHLIPQIPADAIQTADDSLLPLRTKYDSNSDGSIACIRALKGDREAIFYSGATHEINTYPWSAGKLRLETADTDQIKALHQVLSPDMLADLISRLIQRPGVPSPIIKVFHDTDGDRFELQLFPSDADAADYFKTHDGPAIGASLTLSASPKSHLITRVRTSDAAGPLTIGISYGNPQLADIYSLGVPKSAPIIDSRENAAGMLRRIQNLREKGFGNCVAIGTSRDNYSVTIWSVKGNKSFVRKYRARGATYQSSEQYVYGDDWPLPDPKLVIQALRGKLPDWCECLDTGEGSEHRYYPKADAKHVVYPDRVPDLVNLVWPGRSGPSIAPPPHTLGGRITSPYMVSLPKS